MLRSVPNDNDYDDYHNYYNYYNDTEADDDDRANDDDNRANDDDDRANNNYGRRSVLVATIMRRAQRGNGAFSSEVSIALGTRR